MYYLPLTLLAYLLNSVSVTIDKYLLVKKAPNPFVYIFFISLFSLLVLVGLPFVEIPTLKTFIYASLSTILWTAGAYFMFLALKVGNPSRVIPVIGTLIPIILAFIGFISGTLSINEAWAIIILVFGLFFLILPYIRGKISKDEILSVVVSSLFFANSYVVLSWAYQIGEFASVFVYSRIILIPFIVFIYTIPFLRKKYLGHGGSATPIKFLSKSGMLFFAGQAAGGASQLLLTFSISLANPALVNSLQGVQYVFLMIFSFILAKRFPAMFGEKLSRLLWLGRIIGIILIVIGLFILAMNDKPLTQNTKIGVTFSPRYAAELGLDPEKAYSDMLNKMQVKHIRLPVYWDEFEPIEGKFEDRYLKYYLDEAQKNNAKVIVATGYKAPRWPECYPPEWARTLSREELQARILLMLQKTIVLYRNHPAVESWQIENEPFLSFGDCPAQNPLTYEFVKKEIQLVNQLDTRPILITDSGEISSWRKAIGLTSYFGTTMYRQVWNPYIGWFDYPLPSFFYNAKKWLMEKITGNPNVLAIVSELQAEPWVPGKQSLTQWNIDEQYKAFPPQRINKHLQFALSTGFPEIYLWGVEWWIWMDKNGYPEYTDTAKKIFNKSL